MSSLLSIILKILAVVAIIAVVFFLIIIFRVIKAEYLDRPYKLSSLTDDERGLLNSIFRKITANEYGSFRGGGVWTRSAPMEIKQLYGSIQRGRLNAQEMDLLLDTLRGLMPMPPEQPDPYLGNLYDKIDRIRG